MESGLIFDECLSQTIYRDKQLATSGVHLTLNRVFSLSAAGDIDFGGGEYKPAQTEEMFPEKRCETDDYGWWELGGADYMVQFNETVSSDGPTFLVVPNERLIACGCTLAPLYVHSGPIKTMIHVPEQGVSIKENARIALLR